MIFTELTCFMLNAQWKVIGEKNVEREGTSIMRQKREVLHGEEPARPWSSYSTTLIKFEKHDHVKS